MATLFGFLTSVLFIAMLVGMVKPKLVLQWDKKPSRKKVVLYWVGASIFIFFLARTLISDNEIALSAIESSKSLIENNKYNEAIVTLGQIKVENKFFEEAQAIIKNAEELEIKYKEEEKIRSAEANTKAAEENRGQIIEQIKRELESVNKGIDFKQYRGNIELMQMEIVLFGTWASIIFGSENSDDEEIKSLATKLKNKIQPIQVAEFPKLRKEYGKLIGKKMWENDIIVSINGASSNNINFTGGVFAANKNKKDFQTNIQEVLTMFRFKQSRYRWYEGESEYTYYTIYEGKDSELVSFKFE